MFLYQAFKKPGISFSIAIILSLFIWLGFLLSPPGIEPANALINRSLGIVILWAVTFHLYKRQEAERLSAGKENDQHLLLALRAERKSMEEKIQYIARHDELTGLPNRRLFWEIVNSLFNESHRLQKKLAILFLDLDRFKQINDTLGHETGDSVLVQVTERLKDCIRDRDAIARTGGDEFNIVLSDIRRMEDITSVILKIMESFKKPYIIGSREVNVSVSIGISVFPDDSEELETIFRYADIALFHAKDRGRNTFCFYNPAINLQSIDRTKLENSLLHALERRELRVVFQPQVDLLTGKLVCAEVLVRWQHPELGLLEPHDFLPLADEIGFVALIDEWVLRTACIQFKTWEEQGLAPTCVTVNLSARAFQKPSLVENIARTLNEIGFDPSHLELEITESLAMSNIERTIKYLDKLTGLGIRISIDDFGIGYSSLNYLKRLPIYRLKIDQSFIRDIATDQDDRAIIKAVTVMAHSLSLVVVAEGVETQEQINYLRDVQCDQALGHFFNLPLPPEKFQMLLEANYQIGANQ
jgi:diguanylate cyclase (GGDEF)-like protein